MYRVFGYNDLFDEFAYRFNSFTEAVTAFLRLDRAGMNVVFIDGVSDPVRQRLQLM